MDEKIKLEKYKVWKVNLCFETLSFIDEEM